MSPRTSCQKPRTDNPLQGLSVMASVFVLSPANPQTTLGKPTWTDYSSFWNSFPKNISLLLISGSEELLPGEPCWQRLHPRGSVCRLQGALMILRDLFAAFKELWWSSYCLYCCCMAKSDNYSCFPDHRVWSPRKLLLIWPRRNPLVWFFLISLANSNHMI